LFTMRLPLQPLRSALLLGAAGLLVSSAAATAITPLHAEVESQGVAAQVGQVRLGEPESTQRFELPREALPPLSPLPAASRPERSPPGEAAPQPARVPLGETTHRAGAAAEAAAHAAAETSTQAATETAAQASSETSAQASAEAAAQAAAQTTAQTTVQTTVRAAGTAVFTPEGHALELPMLGPGPEAGSAPHHGALKAGTTPVPAVDAQPLMPGSSEPVAATETALPAEQPYAPALPKHTDLWARMRSRFSLPTLGSALVQHHVRFYTSRPDYLERMFDRGGRYLFYIVEEIERRDMPGELALLPFVESAMNPVALSPAKAAGLWQFIPSTGKAFNLSQNWWVDNRRDPVHSTHAALDYLQRIYEMHGNDWFLALASYNWGEGAVGRAIRRNQGAGRPGDYLSLNMPQETRNYVPKLMALREIVAEPERYGIKLGPLPNKPYFVAVEAPMHLDLKLAARFAGMSEEEFVHLNPAHNRPVIAASANDQLKIPADRVDRFLASMRAHEEARKPFSRWRPHTLEPGETLQSLAQSTGTTAQELMRANGMRSAKVLPGTRILAPAAEDRLVQNVSAMTSFEGPRILEKVQHPAVYHRVEKRETMESIARRYGITVASLHAWNNLKAGVRRGTRLLVKPASAQTLLTTESGVPKVIATEVEQPKAASPASPIAAAKPGITPKKPANHATGAAKPATKSNPASDRAPNATVKAPNNTHTPPRKASDTPARTAGPSQKSASGSSKADSSAASRGTGTPRTRPLGATI
jgi:membrane-bound lytic murein transglycosylase D